MKGYLATVDAGQGIVTLESTGESTPVEVPGVRFVSVLGSGANGIAFLGEDGLGRSVTVKVWPPRKIPARTLERAQKQAMAEAMKVANLKHESIGIVYQVSALNNGWPIVVSEYMPGEPLARVREKLELNIRRIVVLSVLSVLAFSEDRGVLHGDLHDRNIIYDPKRLSLRSAGIEQRAPIVRLIDFGTSMFAGREDSGERHARLLLKFVFDLWPELRAWLRPLPILERRVGFDMLPPLKAAAEFVLHLEMADESRPEVMVRLATSHKPSDPVVTGIFLAKLIDDFDIPYIFSRLSEVYSDQELEECQKHFIFMLESGKDTVTMSSDGLKAALDHQLRLHGQPSTRSRLLSS